MTTNNFLIKPTLKCKAATLLVLFFFGLCIASVLSVITMRACANSSAIALAATSAQDILAFIAPAVLTVLLFRQRPTEALCLSRKPSAAGLLAVVAVYFLSLPAMNYLIDCNQHMALPQCLSSVEQWMRQSEELAARQTQSILSFAQSSFGAFACTFAVVAVLAGLSEEVFFRGGWQRFVFSPRINSHAAIWLTAFIFSFIHFQFFGFVPRLLLGAWLGYLLVWSGSLWLPVTAHVLNNGMVVASAYLAGLGMLPDKAIDHLGLPAAGCFPWLALTSAAATAVAIWLLHRRITHREPRAD